MKIAGTIQLEISNSLTPPGSLGCDTDILRSDRPGMLTRTRRNHPTGSLDKSLGVFFLLSDAGLVSQGEEWSRWAGSNLVICEYWGEEYPALNVNTRGFRRPFLSCCAHLQETEGTQDVHSHRIYRKWWFGQTYSTEVRDFYHHMGFPANFPIFPGANSAMTLTKPHLHNAQEFWSVGELMKGSVSRSPVGRWMREILGLVWCMLEVRGHGYGQLNLILFIHIKLVQMRWALFGIDIRWGILRMYIGATCTALGGVSMGQHFFVLLPQWHPMERDPPWTGA